MYNEMIEKISDIGIYKSDLCKNHKRAYMISSMFAGFSIGIGILISYTVGVMMQSLGSPYFLLLLATVFLIALSIVVFTGIELFTGNNFVMPIGCLNKKVRIGDLARIWLFS